LNEKDNENPERNWETVFVRERKTEKKEQERHRRKEVYSFRFIERGVGIYRSRERGWVGV
jgi:hypothetical protein